MDLSPEEQRRMYDTVITLGANYKNQEKQIEQNTNDIKCLQRFKWITLGVCTGITTLFGFLK